MPPTPRKQTAPAPATTPAVPATPLEDTNPPGGPEGTDHGHAGATEAHDTPTGPPGATQPSAADLHVDNSTEDAPASTGTVYDGLARLEAYLRTQHPGEYQDTPDGPEHPADVAIRLLTRLGARGDQGARCQAPYCNLPALHGGEHGWVHVEPATAR